MLPFVPLFFAAMPWPLAAPTAEGFDAAKLQAVAAAAPGHKTKALLVARHGRIVLEWYADGVTPEIRQGTASLAKALVGGMSLLVALDAGRIAIDDPAWKYIPAWKDDPQKRLITIRQLATHSSGLDDAESSTYSHMEIPGWKGAFWRRQPDPISIAIHDAPVVSPPGAKFGYSNPGMAALGYAVTAALRGSHTPDLQSALADRVCRPLGIPDSDWRISYGESYAVDGLKVYATWGGGAYTPRATARIGQLMLDRGRYEGRQLFGEALARRMVSYAGTPIPDRKEDPGGPGSGLGWWTNFDGVWKNVPRDAFAGAGAGQELLLVVPSLDLIIVRNGAAMSAPAENRFWPDMEDYLFNPVIDALRSGSGAAPYPPSPVIARVKFAPPEQIERQAADSDNWPITWADDDALYTSYGDGEGFEPFVERKLSLGLARVTGAPPEFHGVNLRSPSAERTGDGRKGPKASGLLMVDGILYMWVRNTGNAQLVWSDDHGANWHWDFKFEESFGSPAFLNFGRNYAGARDDFVFIYSQDGPSAYASDDRLLLARVPKQSIRRKDAYEFFVRTDADGHPLWTRDLAARGTVFAYPGHCQRVDAVYDAGLRRYLLALGYNHGGAWGIYDAPEPWGPWTTGWHTLGWGLDTHGYRFTSKWMDGSGRSGWLIFSGVKKNDAFCVRRFEFKPR